MKKYIASFILAIAIIFSFVLVAPVVKAATTGNVSATVTVTNLAITVSDGTVAYGTIAVSSTQDTTTSGVDDSQTATNDGNVTSDFNIQGANSTNWTLTATAGSEDFTHKFCTSDCDGSPTWTALTTSYQSLATSISASGNQVFDLQIGTPTSTATFTEQSTTVTVQVVET
jgi:hypothetical protein